MHAITCFVVSSFVLLSAATLPARGQVIGPDAGEARMVGGVRPLWLKVDPQTVGSNQFVAGMEIVPPGAPFPTHKHPDYEEILFIHKGTLTVTIADGSPQEASAGSIVFIPKDTWVGVANKGSESATFIFIFPQTGFEDYLRRVAPKAGEPMLSPEQIAAIRREHHHNIVVQSTPK